MAGDNIVALGTGDIMMGFRLGFTTFFASKAAGMALLVGLFYAGLCVCTTFIFLDRRENTFCVPMHCCSSLLSGLTAVYALAFLFGQNPPSSVQLGSSGLIIVALLLLSPLHHVQRYATRLGHLLSDAYGACLNFVPGFGKQRDVLTTPVPTVLPRDMAVIKDHLRDEDHLTKFRQVFLFVCSGNTCRSPMAEAIGNAEIAARLQIPFETVRQANMRVLSAGVSARAGAPMTPEAQQALRFLGIPATPHGARNLTVELTQQAEKIFCMTQDHHDAVIDLVPSAAAKTQCLDPNGDVEDPTGSGLAAYINCARRIHGLVRLRFDEIGLQGGL